MAASANGHPIYRTLRTQPRWALQAHRQVRLFPYRNVALVFYEADLAYAVAYERALVQLP